MKFSNSLLRNTIPKASMIAKTWFCIVEYTHNTDWIKYYYETFVAEIRCTCCTTSAVGTNAWKSFEHVQIGHLQNAHFECERNARAPNQPYVFRRVRVKNAKNVERIASAHGLNKTLHNIINIGSRGSTTRTLVMGFFRSF